jgi:hypothetical protein
MMTEHDSKGVGAHCVVLVARSLCALRSAIPWRATAYHVVRAASWRETELEIDQLDLQTWREKSVGQRRTRQEWSMMVRTLSINP